MHSLDLQVLQRCASWLHQGRACLLVTVVRTWGSSPRPPGAMMALSADGEIVGSVSGGCIEDDLIRRMVEGLPTSPLLVRYGVTREQAQRFGLPCGGTVELACEPLNSASQIDQLLAHLAQGELVERCLHIDSGQVTISSGAPSAMVQLEHGVLRTLHGPRWRLVVIGAGALSRFLAEVASGMDYQVLVCDPREEYWTDWHLGGVHTSREMPDDVVLAARPDARCAVLALTHDPKLDDLALMEALRSDAFYVGALGSHANALRRRERLREFDLDEAQLARLHGPVGLPIGSRTPAEIAIAILAHMTAIRHGAALPLSLQSQHT